LQFTDLTNATLIYANLVGSNFENTILVGTNLYGTSDLPITKEQALSRGALFSPVLRSGSGIRNPS
jgi:uncharacterized protein YjbI with pentapeptide repeats